METFSASLAICAGNSPITGEFSSQRAVIWSFDIFFDLCLNKRLSKLSWCWWFETPSRSLWRHSSVVVSLCLVVVILWSFSGSLPSIYSYLMISFTETGQAYECLMGKWIKSTGAPTLRWRHNECYSVSNHQPLDCLLNRLSGRRSK